MNFSFPLVLVLVLVIVIVILPFPDQIDHEPFRQLKALRHSKGTSTSTSTSTKKMDRALPNQGGGVSIAP